MGLGTSDTERPTSLKTEETPVPVIPAIPQDIVCEILDDLATDARSRPTLLSCSLVSKSWITPSRRHLFRIIYFDSWNTHKWLETFPVPDRSPTRHVRRLHLSLGGDRFAPEELFKRVQGFTNLKEIIISEDGDIGQSWWGPSFGRLPQSVTSLTINVKATLLQIRDIMTELPNLDDLSLSGSLSTMDGVWPRRIGLALRGRFGGKLKLHGLDGGHGTDIVNMLLEAPDGLHFSEVDIHSTSNCLPSIVKLAEACGQALLRLSHIIDYHGSRESLHRTFNFTKLPNLEVVKSTVHWISGDLSWIPAALSSLGPGNTPRLSILHLSFNDKSPWNPRESRERFRGDLRLIGDEVARIERDFVGTRNSTGPRHPRHEH